MDSQLLQSRMSIPSRNRQAETRAIPFSSLLELSTCAELLFSGHSQLTVNFQCKRLVHRTEPRQDHLRHSPAFRRWGLALFIAKEAASAQGKGLIMTGVPFQEPSEALH